MFFILQGTLLAGEADSLRIERTTADSWFSADKGQHLIGSTVSTVLLSKICENQLEIGRGNARTIGISVTFSLGIGKELMDQHRPGNFFSWKDLSADIAGIAIAYLLLGIQ